MWCCLFYTTPHHSVPNLCPLLALWIIVLQWVIARGKYLFLLSWWDLFHEYKLCSNAGYVLGNLNIRLETSLFSFYTLLKNTAQLHCPSLSVWKKDRLQRLILSLYFSLIATTISRLIIYASPLIFISLCFTSSSTLFLPASLPFF